MGWEKLLKGIQVRTDNVETRPKIDRDKPRDYPRKPVDNPDKPREKSFKYKWIEITTGFGPCSFDHIRKRDGSELTYEEKMRYVWRSVAIAGIVAFLSWLVSLG